MATFPLSDQAAERRRALPDLRDRQTGKLTQLLASRPDLRGISSFADDLDDAVRWSA